MTINDHGIEAAETAARALLDGRLAPIRDLAAADAECARITGQLADARKGRDRAYAAANHAGWSAAELTSLGYPAAAKTAAKHPAARPAAGRKATTTTSGHKSTQSGPAERPRPSVEPSPPATASTPDAALGDHQPG
jgi:hypothetical protein